LKLAGMERDGESKNYYDHARVENFNIGRFLSKDLLRGKAEYPQSWNRYSYVLNNPMNLTDRWGYEIKKSDNTGGSDCPDAGTEPCYTETVDVPVPPEPVPDPPAEPPNFVTFTPLPDLDASFAQAWTVWTAFLGNFVSKQFWKNELGTGGCYAAFLEGAGNADVLGKVLMGQPDIAETTIKVQASTWALRHTASRTLSYPMRSSIVRGMLELGETGANAFGPLYINAQVGFGLAKEIKALREGECH
jgi:RHS repeat-associated protein